MAFRKKEGDGTQAIKTFTSDDATPFIRGQEGNQEGFSTSRHLPYLTETTSLESACNEFRDKATSILRLALLSDWLQELPRPYPEKLGHLRITALSVLLAGHGLLGANWKDNHLNYLNTGTVTWSRSPREFSTLAMEAGIAGQPRV